MSPISIVVLVVVALALASLAFTLGHWASASAAGDERDELIKFYDAKLAGAARENKIGLDRFKALLNDVKTRATENDALVVDLENKWQAQPAEHHRGKAAAYRDILTRYRGW
ncbi:MAG: hypothetical protein IMZ71_01385 [Chloroflexi bacterium]|nr:hypothetical protein [Chloroflexota bacterium]